MRERSRIVGDSEFFRREVTLKTMLTAPRARAKSKDMRPSRPKSDASLPSAQTRPASAQFSAPTLDWQSSASMATRRSLGQFMTPRHLRELLLDRLKLWPGMRVLDPGVGTGEFLRSVLDREPNANCFGWDVDSEILGPARRLVPEAELLERSALDPYVGEPFDLVIGNPPYFQFRPSVPVRRQFSQVISGRPNMFALFFHSGINVLAKNGRLAFVAPPSMNNGAYFNGLRDYIISMGGVEWLRVFAGEQLFEDAQTAVQLIVCGDRSGASNHVFRRSVPSAGFHRTIFTEDADKLAREFESRPTLFDLGYEAVTGSIVWNQHRDKLRQEAGLDRVPLLWAQNIVKGEIALGSTARRPQYVETSRVLKGPAIVVNRIVGAVGSGEVRCALVSTGMRFVGENHVNVVRVRRGSQPSVSWEELLGLMSHPHVGARAVLLTGNTQISATELTHLMPLGA